MSDIKDQKNLEELRRRLYERGFAPEERVENNLTPQEVKVSRGWDFESNIKRQQDIVPKSATTTTLAIDNFKQEEIVIKKPKRRYRLVILIISFLFFVITTAVSSIYLFFGANQISAKNINLTLNAPFTTAGGEVAALQVNITNQNSVPVNSAILIVNYPPGTRSADEGVRELYEERIPVEDIAPGESVNLPLQVVLYGEENEVKQIKVAIEYRVAGSNGRFFKEIDPQNITISSAPLVVSMIGVDKISSGQVMPITLKIKSNSTIVQKNILVSISYPNTFSFEDAKPEPVYGKNSWLIEELLPGQSTEIVVKGRVAGQVNETAEVQVRVGNPELDNQFLMGAVFSQAKFGYIIEQPFTGVSVQINGDVDGKVVLSPGTDAKVVVLVKNTLDKSIYDMRVSLKPTGNLIRDDLLVVSKGFYDTDTKTIQYETSGQTNLAEIRPGESREFNFTVRSDVKQTTASFNVSADIYAKRITEGKPIESLIGTMLAEVKYSSTPTFGSELGYNNGPFTDSGAIPPIAGLPTVYTVTLKATAGVNDMNTALVTTSLPQYITWLDKVEGEGKIDFNPVSKQLRWNIGDITTGMSKSISFQVSLLPSITQVGQDAVLINEQEFKAVDSFTGTSLYSKQSPLRNQLSTELGFAKDNGIIRKKD